MKKFVLPILAVLAGLQSSAQNEADVQRLSSHFVMGTARNAALGGAMGALGGDMSAIFQNPAAVGVFRFSELSITPGVEMNKINSTLNGESTDAQKTKFVISNGGFVLANETKNPNWRSFNVGIAFTRVNTFNDLLKINTLVPYEQSLVNDFVLEANGFEPDDLSNFSAGIAYDTFVIDNPVASTTYEGIYIPGDLIQQDQVAERDGRINETSLAFGGNFKDVLFIGGSLNFQTAVYDSEVRTTETYVSSTNPPFPGDAFMTSYTLTETLETDGIGVNLKLGFIAKAGDVLRFGASFQTPTTFSLTDDYTSAIRSEWINDNTPVRFEEFTGFFQYRVRTPWRYTLSAAGFIGSKGFISGQYEYANFAGGKLLNSNNSNEYGDFDDINNLIASAYAGVHVLRIGAEYRATKSLSFRGGFARFNNPVPGNEEFADGANLNRFQYSGGLGYRKATWSADISYVMSTYDELYKVTGGGSIATLENALGLAVLTLSYRL